MNMKMKQTALLILCAMCSLNAEASAQRRQGSIYNPDHGPFVLVGNRTARRPGDLVTIIISENQDVRNEESSDLSTQKGLDYQLTAFDLKPNMFSTLPTLQSNTEDSFRGSANYEKTGTFSARMTAVVVDKLPNGNLVVNGRREIRVDNEVKVIEFSGVVRRFDIDTDNTVQSELVADARITYTGTGPMTRATNRHGLGGFLHDALAWLWPF
jgi:flagellar L-ring protein precursor FlgH